MAAILCTICVERMLPDILVRHAAFINERRREDEERERRHRDAEARRRREEAFNSRENAAWSLWMRFMSTDPSGQVDRGADSSRKYDVRGCGESKRNGDVDPAAPEAD